MESQHEYRLPFAEDSLVIAISDPKAHYSDWANAVDFLMGYNVEILAARGGKVIDVKDDSNEGGLEEKFQDTKFQNYIIIEHENGEYSQYVHLG